MYREFGRRLHYVSMCPIKIFAVADMDAYWYPYKLQHIGTSRPGTREECLEYMIDSDIGDEDATNEDVLDRAHELNATYVVPKDYLHGLGMGASPAFVAAVREEPRLVDSVDLQTPEKCAQNGQTFGRNLKQVDVLSPRGDWSSTHRANDSLGMLLKLNYLMGPLVNEDKAEMLANRLLTSF